jgi:hypothetical protein
MFADHRLEIFHHFERDRVFGVAEIHERAGISAMIRKDYLDRAVWIDFELCGLLPTANENYDESERDKRSSRT